MAAQCLPRPIIRSGMDKHTFRLIRSRRTLCYGANSVRIRKVYYSKVPYICEYCGNEYFPPSKNLCHINAGAMHRVCFDPVCREKNRQRNSEIYKVAMRERLANGGRQRMIDNNPMKDPATREKMRQTLHSMQWKPQVHGGNGHGPTRPELALMEELGPMWKWNYVIVTGMPRSSGFPRCYKPDLALPELRIAVEVDGYSHCSLARQAQDAKKEKFLSESGWLVLRFKNAAVLADPKGIAAVIREFSISKSREITTTLQAASLSTTACVPSSLST